MKKVLIQIVAIILLFSIHSVSVYANTPVTVIDLTDFTNGSDVTQPCIWINTFDTANHYQVCTLHGEKRNISPHVKKIVGSDVCYEDVVPRIETCSAGCGYTKTLPKKAHTLMGVVPAPFPHGIAHARQCSACVSTGRLENVWFEHCKDARGNPLRCSNAADQTCAACGTLWPRNQHGEAQNSSKCNRCSTQIMSKVSTSVKYLNDTTVQIISDFTFLPGTTGINFSHSIHLYTGVPIPYTLSGAGLSWQVVQTLSMSKDVSATYTPSVCFFAVYQGAPLMTRTILFNTVHPDNTPPKITNTTINPPGDVWARNKSITVTATDAFTPQNNNVVSMGLFEESGATIVPYGQANATSNATVFTKTFVPDIEVNTNKKLIVKVRDRWGNESSSPVIVSKIDRVAPQLLTLGPYASPWTKSRPVVFEASDAGMGKAEMAFSKTSDFSAMNASGVRFLRSYLFVGDVYREQARKVYLRDGLGNVSTFYVKFNRLDSTVPTITGHNSQVNDKKTSLQLQLKAHDKHSVLGEGSGTAKYALLKTNATPKPSDFLSQNNFILTENGMYYAYCMDAVGNISAVYPIKITELIEIPEGGDTDGFAHGYAYHTNTDVYTTIEIENTTESSLYAEDAVTATLQIVGDSGFRKTLSKRVIIPKGRKSMVWFAWHTPDAAQNATATATITHGVSITNPKISCTITKLSPASPPDPIATDSNPGWISTSPPTFSHQTTATWGEWNYNKPEWKWQAYTSTIAATAKCSPDTEVPTAMQSDGQWSIRSGYGINMQAKAVITGDAEHTPAQNAVYLFPEFQYKTYARVGRSAIANHFTLPQNLFSQYKQPVHFTPLWYPDGEYKPYCVLFDCWTPGGQLSTSATDTLEIQGDLFEDWHIGPTKG